MRHGAVLLLAACMAACAVPGPREPDRYFVLEASLAPRAPGASVAVAPTAASGFYDTQDIAFSRAPGTRAYYQFNRWAERPQHSLHRILASRLQGTGPDGRWRLETRLEEIYHDATGEPGTARITVAAELANPATRSVLARRTFTRTAPAASYDAPGAVHGFNQALAALVGDIEAWVDAEVSARR